MSRQERRSTSVTWGPRRGQSFVGKIKNFSKLVSGLSERVAELSERAEPPPPKTDAEEALTVLQLEHEALLVAEEELRAQLEELEAGHVLVQAERRRFEHMFEAAPDGYVVTDGYGTIQELNPAMAKLLGGAPRSFIRKPLSLYVDERHRRGFRDFLSTLGAEPSAELEIAVLGPESKGVACAVAVSRMPLPAAVGTRDGTLFWRFRRMPASEERAARVSTLPPPPSSTSPDAAAAELERRWARERAARERLEHENKGKDRLLAMVSHDLRAPLHAMLSWAQLIRKSGSDDTLRHQALAAIERSGRTQVALLEDLLDVSRIAEGKLTVEHVALDLTATVRTALEALVPRAREAGIELSWELANVTMAGDVTRLQQVVTNLISNALKFTRRGGAVYVSLERDGADAVLRVRDTGKGIAREALDSVFECFRQESGSEAREGMGLGLYITRHIVERHGGTIHAYSDGPGTGSVFTARFPAHEIPVAAASAVALPTATLSALNVVVVSDDAETCELLTSGLRRASPLAAVSCATFAEMAYGLDVRCDIVIVDVPADITRCAAVARAARARRNVPVIAISAFASPSDVHAILDAGFDAHLAKPFSTDDLTATIRAALPEAAEA